MLYRGDPVDIGGGGGGSGMVVRSMMRRLPKQDGTVAVKSATGGRYLGPPVPAPVPTPVTVISAGTTGQAQIASTTSGITGFVNNSILPSLFETTPTGAKAPNWSNIAAAAVVLYAVWRILK